MTMDFNKPTKTPREIVWSVAVTAHYNWTIVQARAQKTSWRSILRLSVDEWTRRAVREYRDLFYAAELRLAGEAPISNVVALQYLQRLQDLERIYDSQLRAPSNSEADQAWKKTCRGLNIPMEHA